MKETDLEVVVNRVCQSLTDVESDIRCAKTQILLAERNNKDAIKAWIRLAKKLKVKIWDVNL